MKNDLQYVYKYVDDTSRVVYVGITNDMQKRVYQHKHDKLKAIKNPVIYYFPVKYRADADMLETYLINHYGTGKYYNVSKTQKGDFSFFDMCDDIPWHRYAGKVDDQLKPFVVSDIAKEKTVVVEKTVFARKDSLDAKIREIDNAMLTEKALIEDLISFEVKLSDALQAIPNYKEDPAIVKGLRLHKKRLICARLLKRHPMRISGDKKRDFLLFAMNKTKVEIDKHEEFLAEVKKNETY